MPSLPGSGHPGSSAGRFMGNGSGHLPDVDDLNLVAAIVWQLEILEDRAGPFQVL